MGPVWKMVRGVKDVCTQCGVEIENFPAVGRVVDFQFIPSEKFCPECYKYNSRFVDEVDPPSLHPFQPVTRPVIP